MTFGFCAEYRQLLLLAPRQHKRRTSSSKAVSSPAPLQRDLAQSGVQILHPVQLLPQPSAHKTDLALVLFFSTSNVTLATSNNASAHPINENW